MYKVLVHFAVASFPSTIGEFRTLADAERAARAYLSDARGVWIQHPDGSREVVR